MLEKNDLLGFFLSNDELVQRLRNFLGSKQLPSKIRLPFLDTVGLERTQVSIGTAAARNGGKIWFGGFIQVRGALNPTNLNESAVQRKQLEGSEIEGGFAIGAEIEGLIDASLAARNGQWAIGEDDRHLLGAPRTVDIGPNVIVVGGSFPITGVAFLRKPKAQSGGVGFGLETRKWG